MQGSVPSVYLHVCVCTHWARLVERPIVFLRSFVRCHTLVLMGSNSQAVFPWLSSSFASSSQSKLGPRTVLELMCKVRAGLTPFCLSFKIRSGLISIQPCSKRASICLHADLLIRAQRWPWHHLPHLIQTDLDHGGKVRSSFLKGPGLHSGPVEPASRWRPRASAPQHSSAFGSQ